WSRADVTGTDIHEVLHALSLVVSRTAIALNSGTLLMLSAVAVAAPDAREAAVLVGPRGRGLTEAATALGRDFVYLADQTTGITSDGQVLPALAPLAASESANLRTWVAPSSLV